MTRHSLPASLDAFGNRQWQKFCESLQQITQSKATPPSFSDPDKICQSRPELKQVWACSDFISNACISNPMLLVDLLASGDLDRKYSAEQYADLISRQIGSCADETQLHERLRQVRQREMIRMAWRDLAGLADLDETMGGVSVLAEQAISSSLAHHSKWQSQRYGNPMGSKGETASMVVLGLGKLGGGELNYSSDVDLLFAYDHPGETRKADGKVGLDNQSYFIKLGQKIITALDQVTSLGFVFRTDMRLRPNGDSGPLVLSFPALEHYYQTHGRNWERYALIKARQVAGTQTSGNELLSLFKPFIYRKYLDFGAFDSIREMKSMIERELKQSGYSQNIKLGWGGIREVEFLVQSHQLIRGGRETALQTQSLYTAMAGLNRLGVIDDDAMGKLMQGYQFLRNTEHRLQMVADRQTQMLPDDEFAQLRLAWSMGFENWQQYIQQLEVHRSNIQHQFRMILDEGENTRGRVTVSTGAQNRLVDLWQGRLDDEQSERVLKENGFASSDAIPHLLKGFRQGRLYQAFSGVERDRIDRLIPLALCEVVNHGDGERAMAAFISVIESIGRRSVYLSLLIENPIALKQLLHLCAASSWVSRHIGQHPVILDELLHPIVDIRHRTREDINRELEYRLGQFESEDEEGRMNALREFQHAQVLRIAAADVSGVLTVDDIHQALTLLAEVLLNRVFDDALEFVRRKLGPCPCEGGVIAYGKFASGELGYHSDLDVVVCYEPSQDDVSNSEAENFYSRVGRRLIHLITSRTPAGLLYEIDMRLRPSGRSGTLVASLSGFLDYQMNNAWTWEHQALVRARVVVGSDGFREKFEQSRKTILSLERDPAQLIKDIVEMRGKMIDANCQSTEQLYDIKLDEGGIVDIEFLIQYWVLKHAREQSSLVSARTTKQFIELLVATQILDIESGDNLLQSYKTYLRYSLDLKLMDQPVLTSQQDLLDERRVVRAIWHSTFNTAAPKRTS